jgi:hypothetical protein
MPIGPRQRRITHIDQRPKQGKSDLPAVGMAAQHQAGCLPWELRESCWVVRENNHGVADAGLPDQVGQSRCVRAYADNRDLVPVKNNTGDLITKNRQTSVPECTCDGRPSIKLVVVAENGKASERRLHDGEDLGNRLWRDTAPAEEQAVDVVTTQAHQVRLELRGGAHDSPEPFDVVRVTAHVQVGQKKET